MPRSDDEPDDLDKCDDPDDADMDDSDEPDLIACPHCGKSISEDAERCHHCGNYLSREDAPRRMPIWIIIGAVVAIIVVLTWLF